MYVPKNKIESLSGEEYIFTNQEYQLIKLVLNRTEKHHGKHDPIGLDEVVYITNKLYKENTVDEILLKIKKIEILKKFVQDKKKKIEELFIKDEIFSQNFELDRLHYYYSTVLRRIYKLIKKFLNKNLLI